jgi:acetyl-CoA C-acetyltransferase
VEHDKTWIVGAAQHVDREGDPEQHPARAMAAAAVAALADAGIRDLGRVDLLACVESFSWTYADLGGTVASEIGLPDGVEHLWTLAGGTSPQDLLHKIGPRVAAGEIECAVICGAEAMRTRRRAAKAGRTLDWPPRPEGVHPMRGQPRFVSDLEYAHGVTLATNFFPLLENAIRKAEGRSAAEQRRHAAELLAANARVAADNPYAWFRDAPSTDEIETVSEANRMIAYPYTKRMNAIMEVNQSAALVVASESFAREHGLDGRAAVVLGGAGAEEIWNPIERNTFAECPAMSLAFGTALGRAGLVAEDLDAMDLYSCFPSAIQLALRALRIEADRPLSLTGGLAFAGGPGNAYVLHALAAALERIRKEPGARLLVTGIGMANTKHAATVLTGPDHVPDAATGEATYREARDETPREVDPRPSDTATIATWTIEYDRAGEPSNAILYLDLEGGARTVANMRDVAAAADALLAVDPIGRRGRVEYDADADRNFFAFD